MISLSKPEELRKIFQEIGVDPYGTKIMLPKAMCYVVRLNSISNITANILKQEMLSLGGDVAVARGALTGKARITDCLLIGNLSQINRLNLKLNQQPFGLDRLAKDLTSTLVNYQRDKFILNLGRYKLNLSRRIHVMGIVNVTPNSFSGDGFYKKQKTARPGKCSRRAGENRGQILDYVQKMIRDGADIIDIGGESSRPGAKPVSVKEELARTIPVIKALAKKIKLPISIDTYKPQVAKQALESGAVMVNDIKGLRNPSMAKVVARYKAGLVIMHMKGNPKNMQNEPRYHSLIQDIIEFLSCAINRARDAGIDKEKIIIDPGIGFGKTLEHNLQIINRLKEFKVLGRPILVGPSRKSFIGRILKVGPQERIFGTVSSCILAAKNGANIVRVHDVGEVKEALKISDGADKCWI